MSAISQLNADALRHVFLQAPLADLLNATRVDKSWHHLAQELIDNEIELELSPSRQEVNLKLMSRLHNDNYLRNRVHHIRVVDWLVEHPLKPREAHRFGRGSHTPLKNPWQKGGYLSKPSWKSRQRDDFRKDPSWPQLVSLSRAVADLTLSSFTWAAVSSMPTVLANALSLKSNCKIKVKRHDQALRFVFWTYSPVLKFGDLNKLTCLNTVLTQLELTLPPITPSLYEKLRVFISKCSLLRDLSLYSLGRIFSEGATLEVATDLDWLFRSLLEAGRVLRVDRLDLSNFCLCGTSDLDIGHIIDTSCLRKSTLTCFNIFRNLEGGLPLTSFTLHVNGIIPSYERFCLNDWSIAAVQKFLICCHKIQKLEIIDCHEILNDELVCHLGRTLQDLRVYTSHELQNEAYQRAAYLANGADYNRKRPGSSLQTTFEPHMVINSLATHCPRLKHLSIHAPRVMEQFMEFLRLIGDKLPQVTSCTFVRAEESTAKAVSERLFTLENMSNIWTQVRTQDSRLCYLEIILLSRDPWRYSVGPSLGVHTKAGRHRRFLVTKSSSVVLSAIEKRLRAARRHGEQRGKFVQQISPSSNLYYGHRQSLTSEFLAIEEGEMQVQRICQYSATRTVAVADRQ